MSLVRKTFHGYAAPTIGRPVWHVGYLVFQGGVPKTRGNSITGGGQIYGHELGLLTANVLKDYSTPVSAQMGSGQIVGLPPEVTVLLGGNAGVGS